MIPGIYFSRQHQTKADMALKQIYNYYASASNKIITRFTTGLMNELNIINHKHINHFFLTATENAEASTPVGASPCACSTSSVKA